MKKSIRKIICIMLVISLTVLALAMLSSCNKKDNMDRDTQRDAQIREESCSTMLNNIMKVASKDWNANMTDQQIVDAIEIQYETEEVSVAGEYVSNYYWAKFFVDTIKASDLRNSKLTTMNSFIESELKKRDEATGEKAEIKTMSFVLDFISNSGLLSEESASLSYLVISSILDQAQSVYANAIDKCRDLINPNRTDITVSDKARASIQKEIEDMERSRDFMSSALSKTVKDSLLKAMSDSQAGFEAMFKIVYEFGGMFTTGQVKDVVDGGKGAMSNLSKNDIINFLDSIRVKLQTMNNYFVTNKEDVEKIKNTFDQVSNITNTFVAKNTIVSGALNIVRYVNTAVDIIPILTDIVLKSWSVFENDETFIDDIITYLVKAEDVQNENAYIFAARALIEYKKNAGATLAESKAYSKAFINTIDNNILGDIYSSVIYIFLELVMDTNNDGKYFDIDREGKTDEQIQDEINEYLNKVSNPVWAMAGLFSLQKKYSQFLALDSVTRSDVTYAVNSVVNTLKSFGVVSEDLANIAEIPEGNTDGWYTNVYNLLEGLIIEQLVPQAIEITDSNMLKYIDEIYVDGVLEGIATAEFVTREDTESYKDPNRAALEEKIEDASLIKLFMLLPIFINLFSI